MLSFAQRIELQQVAMRLVQQCAFTQLANALWAPVEHHPYLTPEGLHERCSSSCEHTQSRQEDTIIKTHCLATGVLWKLS